jgi:hypothetical protein
MYKAFPHIPQTTLSLTTGFGVPTTYPLPFRIYKTKLIIVSVNVRKGREDGFAHNKASTSPSADAEPSLPPCLGRKRRSRHTRKDIRSRNDEEIDLSRFFAS